MKAFFKFICGILFIITLNRNGFADTNLVKALSLSRPTPAYKAAAFKLMLAEANLYVERLHLPEKLPLTKGSVAGFYISPPEFADRYGGLGRFNTTNYSYGFGRSKRLVYITRLPKYKSEKSLYEKFKPWAIAPSAVNTNAAYMVATQFLAEAFVDLPRLTNLEVSIHPLKILNMTTSIYDLEWKKGDRNIVEVGLDQPKEELWLLRVEDPSLILRKPLVITNLDYLLSQTNAPMQADFPVKR